MPVALLDVNVLFALAWVDHIHHEVAHQWFARQRPEGWATCPVTQCGFVRISSNPKITSRPTTPVEALELLFRIVAFSGHEFWPDDLQLTQVMGAGRLAVRGHLQIADAYLVGLAIHRGGRLATFDKRAASLATGTVAGAVEVINPFPPNVS